MEEYTVSVEYYGEETSKLIFKFKDVRFASFYFQVNENNIDEFEQLCECCRKNYDYEFNYCEQEINFSNKYVKFVTITTDNLKNLDSDEYGYSEFVLKMNDSLIEIFDKIVKNYKDNQDIAKELYSNMVERANHESEF